MSAEKLKCIDLFCGCGGLTQGFELAGIDVVCGIDVWDKAIETYKLNHTRVALCEDITKLDPAMVAEKIGNKKIDIVAGGIPCQAFSMAGKRDVNDKRAVLYEDFMRFVGYFDPNYVVIENVLGILTMKDKDGGLVKDKIFGALQNMGYIVEHAKLLAADYGVPQKRRRVFIAGRKPDTMDISFPPSKTHLVESHIGVKSILESRDAVPQKYFHSEKMIQGFMRRKEENKKKGKGFGAQFVDMNKPSYTISARYWKDGADALVKYSDTKVRMLTEKEVARIQSFPDEYIFAGTSRDIYTQVGNAVPVELARHVGASIVKSL